MTFGEMWPKFDETCKRVKPLPFKDELLPLVKSISSVESKIDTRYVQTGRIKNIAAAGSSEFRNEPVPCDILRAFEEVQTKFFILEHFPSFLTGGQKIAA